LAGTDAAYGVGEVPSLAEPTAPISCVGINPLGHPARRDRPVDDREAGAGLQVPVGDSVGHQTRSPARSNSSVRSVPRCQRSRSYRRTGVRTRHDASTEGHSHSADPGSISSKVCPGSLSLSERSRNSENPMHIVYQLAPYREPMTTQSPIASFGHSGRHSDDHTWPGSQRALAERRLQRYRSPAGKSSPSMR
jgi:hypothetical protein